MLENLFGRRVPTSVVSPADALRGRSARAFPVPATHAVLGTPLEGPLPDGAREIFLGLGCFWGAEKLFWQLPGVISTSVGYMGGSTPHPTYEETCTGMTGHTETVRVVFDPSVVSDEDVLRTFWENHDPTQGFRQGNDVGTQYRSAIFTTTPEQAELAERTRAAFGASLAERGFAAITTEVRTAEEAGPFYLAEAVHQQYLHKVPHGYCPVHATGVRCEPLDG